MELTHYSDISQKKELSRLEKPLNLDDAFNQVIQLLDLYTAVSSSISKETTIEESDQFVYLSTFNNV